MRKRLINFVGACMSAALLAACGVSNNGLSSPSPASHFAGAAANLYVLDRGTTAVTVYAPPKQKVVRTISKGLTSPWQQAFDGSGNLYVANIGNFSSGPYNVTVYAHGSKSVLRTISDGVSQPSALAFDGSGNLYVSNLKSSGGGNDVTVYAPGTKSVLETISDGVSNPWALVFDGSGNLYVANNGQGSKPVSSVTVYSGGSLSLLRTIFKGVSSPKALAVDGSGNIYVSNCGECYSGGKGNVTVYAPGSKKVLRTITQGLDNPFGIAFDGSGNLYVANFGCPSSSCTPSVPSTVTVYAPGSKSVLRTISKGVIYPAALTFDGSGNLYVGNDGCGSSSCSPSIPSTVSIYAPGSTSVLHTISTGVSFPNSLAFGP